MHLPVTLTMAHCRYSHYCSFLCKFNLHLSPFFVNANKTNMAKSQGNRTGIITNANLQYICTTSKT